MATPLDSPTMVDLTQQRDDVRAEQALLLASGLAVPTAQSLLAARAALLENKLHDIGLDLETVRDSWLSWLRVPVPEIDRLGLEPAIGDFSFRDATHYYLDGADCNAYCAARQLEGSAELVPAQRQVGKFPFDNDISRMDDYRARDYTRKD